MEKRNKIVTNIYSTLNWNELFNNCNILHNREDLKQMISLHLLELDEEILNNMFNTKTFKFYVIRLILNQRNGKNTEFSRLNTMIDWHEWKYITDEQYHEQALINKEGKENKLVYVFDQLNAATGNDYDDVARQLLSIYYQRKYVKGDKLNYTKFAKELKISRNTLNDLLVHAKKSIKDGYNNIIN